MSFKTVKYEVADRVATITLNRPERLNAFSPQQCYDLEQATEKARNDKDVRVVILTGSGRGFSAGADLQGGEQADPEVPRPRNTEEALLTAYYPSLRHIMEMPKPVIAAVNGPAAGVGAAFAMAGDLCIMAEKAYIMLAFSNIALVPDGGANWLLTRAIGYQRAYMAAIEAEKIKADRCLELGLANKVVSGESLMEEASNWAKKLATRSPQALGHTKELMRGAATSSYDDTFKREAVRQNALSGSPDNKEGIAAFIEKRPANFTG